ncbi:MAG TPA: hypothetical protein VN033_09700 [Vulgatibacter sp.]|nr:hypothetical protein [Vulgatibacter sp.]
MRHLLAAALFALALPHAALAQADEDRAAEATAPEETPEQKRARLEAERDAARIKALNYGLPWYTQEAADKQKELDELDAQTASDEGAGDERE